MLTPSAQPQPVHAYAEKLRQLHRLFVEGKADSEEADAIRDEMDSPWYAMSEREHNRLGGLSEDLYALAEGLKQVPMSVEERKAWGESIAGTVSTGDWDGTLQLLRRAPNDLPADRILFAQAWCWHRLGDAETALVFLQEAMRRCPSPLLDSDVQTSVA